ncbi:flagellar basal body-associated FliL family protein [Parvularcula lutaonensis]|uniref:Flagellar protein FliL n=1 Tax=Parvularcula lutaonensis TaxID=491923 RepID=A0ABV7M860_9PROT|nr:flagellar basal body-associated FliL family protein [Parvularcula lutaonensis]GGY43911.1 hypothetical protein GCM10007148_10930 [Parvularcula lutaonensis]
MVYGKFAATLALALVAAVTAPTDAEAAPKSKKVAVSSTVKLNRPFVVPVSENHRTVSVVVLRVNIEMKGKDALEAQESESLLRDRILTALIGLSHDGHFDMGITDPALSDLIKTTIRDAVEALYPEAVEDVLIQDFLRKRII